jgi:tetratricopeptide (TPR) repeat protein
MMRTPLLAGLVVALTLPLAAQQQDNSAPAPQKQNPPAHTNPALKKDQPKKSDSDQNPFPEAQSEDAAHQAQQQSSSPDAPKPQTAPPTGPQKQNSDQNPFPEAQSEKAAHEAQQQDNPAPNPASGAANQDDYSSSHVKGLDMPDTSEAPPPANLPPSPLPFNPKLARKDANIGDFYMESGNWKGAYDRFLEANRSDPGNADAVFGLAESASHLGHRDEALRNYRLYLSALPNGPHAKEIHKALKEMGAEPPA